jgi:hypothetical protein
MGLVKVYDFLARRFINVNAKFYFLWGDCLLFNDNSALAVKRV